jgi:hypothetical protein
VKLLNNVRGRDELEIVLNKTGKEHEEKYEQLARLDLALKFQEKPVRIAFFFYQTLSLIKQHFFLLHDTLFFISFHI